MHGFFFELTILIVIASITSILFRFLKQPPIVAYIITGIFAAQFFLINGETAVSLQSLSEIGITLLLFILGIELKISNLRSIGKVALITGLSQILLTLSLGFGLLLLLGFNNTDAFYLSLGLSLSSTIVIIKLLSDKKDLNSLYGKITVGVLLVQDFFAILSLIILTSSGSGNLDLMTIVLLFLKAILLIVVIILMGKYIFPALVHYLSRSQEILFLSSLAWALGFALFVSSPFIGFSIEIGGFLAGLALANSIESTQIISKVRALRDFFIVIFFVVLGSQLELNNIVQILPRAIALSLFVLVIKPLITTIILLLQKYTSRTSVFTGISLGQVSEFSLILVVLGQRISGVSNEAANIITLTAVICFIFSPYFVLYNQSFYKIFSSFLKKIEYKHSNESKYLIDKEFENHFILVGADRMGLKILHSLKKDINEIVIIDFNPDIIKQLHTQGYNAIFGDISDSDIHEKINSEKAEFVFSSVPDFQDNVILINSLKKQGSKAVIIVTAHTELDKRDLLKYGADFVVMPYSMAAKSIARAINNDKLHLLS